MAKIKFSGYMGDLSPEQESVMQLIEGWVRETNIIDMEALIFDQTDILRFCRARKFKEADIKEMITSFAEWREAENVDTLNETWIMPEL